MLTRTQTQHEYELRQERERTRTAANLAEDMRQRAAALAQQLREETERGDALRERYMSDVQSFKEVCARAGTTVTAAGEALGACERAAGAGRDAQVRAYIYLSIYLSVYPSI